MRLPAPFVPFCLLAATLLTGCSVAFNPTPNGPAQTSIGTLSGTAYGGQQPIIGAKIYLFAAGTSAYGGPGIAASTSNASTSLLNSTVPAVCTSTGASGGSLPCKDSSGNYYVLTDSNGAFSVGGEYTCSSGTQIYLYSAGGQPTTGVTNTAASLMAALGNCPASGTLAQQTPFVYMNEVTTVAAAYAVAGFASDALHISSGPSALAATGLKNAFANAAQMANIAANGVALATTPGYVSSIAEVGGSAYTVAPTVTIAPSASGGIAATATATASGGKLTFTVTNPGSGYFVAPAVTLTGGTYTTAATATATLGTGNGTVPQQLLNTVANILANCVNSSGTTTACTTLFSDDRSGGGQTGTTPTETATAAIYLAQHPYSAYVTNLYSLPTTTQPFAPQLGTAPASFIVELLFSGGGLGATFEPTPSFLEQNLAIDASGNIWTATSNTTVGKFSPQGVSLAGTTGFAPSGCGFSGTDLSTSVAINSASTQAWVGITNQNSVCILNSSGGYVAETSVSGNDGYRDGPFGIAFDSSGNAWVTNDYSAEANQNKAEGQLIEISGTTYGVLATKTGNGMDYPFGIAIEPSGNGGNIWVSNLDTFGNGVQDYDSVFTSSGGNASVSATGNGNTNNINGAGMAIDSDGSIWTVNAPFPGPGGVSKTVQAGTSTSYFGQNAAATAAAIAIDGAGNVWYDSTTGGISYSPFNNTILEGNNSGTLLSPSAGYVPITDASSTSPEPNGIAVDGSGNVWYVLLEYQGYRNISPLRELVGAATPVATPIAYGVANSLLGSKP